VNIHKSEPTMSWVRSTACSTVSWCRLCSV